jgi:hypothetical protein
MIKWVKENRNARDSKVLWHTNQNVEDSRIQRASGVELG